MTPTNATAQSRFKYYIVVLVNQREKHENYVSTKVVQIKRVLRVGRRRRRKKMWGASGKC